MVDVFRTSAFLEFDPVYLACFMDKLHLFCSVIAVH